MKATKFTAIEAGSIQGPVTGDLNGNAAAVKGSVLGAVTVTASVDTTLTAAQAAAPAVSATFSAASKSLVLGIKEGQVMFVYNAGGTNAFTCKGQSGDSGTSIGAGKVALVIGSETANATAILVLN